MTLDPTLLSRLQWGWRSRGTSYFPRSRSGKPVQFSQSQPAVDLDRSAIAIVVLQDE
jgi:hypothetical protein